MAYNYNLPLETIASTVIFFVGFSEMVFCLHRQPATKIASPPHYMLIAYYTSQTGSLLAQEYR